MLASLEERKGYVVEAKDGDIGTARDFLFDDARWTVRYLVVETKRFFGPEVLIAPDSVVEVDDVNKTLKLNLGRFAVKHSPPVDTAKPISRQYQRIYLGYYGLPTWWDDADTSGILPPEMREGGAASDEEGDPHLRSANEVKGYLSAAIDGELGEVRDYIVDSAWGIRYLVLDTRRWWFGHWVLVPPGWSRQIDWPERLLHLDVTRAAVRSSPEWHPGAAIEPVYETQLHRHYGRTPPPAP